MESKPNVLVTGAGRGLGRAIAEKFHAQGFQVIASDYDESLLADLVDVEGYITARLDVGDVENAAALAAEIAESLGRLDVIVNNAGLNSFYPVCEAPPEKTIAAFRVNTFGALITTQACLDLLIASKGRVINIASESSTFRTPFQYYQASKMALEALSDVLRRELLVFDVHVATIRPGAIKTELTDALKAPENAVPNSRFQKVFEKFAKGVAERAPTKLCTPAQMAEVIYFAAIDPRKKPMYKSRNTLMLRVMSKLPAKLVDNALRKELSVD